MTYDITESRRHLAAVILAYGDGIHYQALLADLLNYHNLDGSRVVIVHNPSRPGEILQLPDGVQATVIENESNVGYAAGMNVGVARALETEPEWILILTHDVRIGTRDIDALCDALSDNRTFAVVGPALCSPDGTVYSTGMTRTGPSRVAHRTVRRSGSPSEPWECDGLDGSAMLWRASVLRELRGFDKRFFMYWEDVELCTRAVQAGWKVGSVDSASAVSIPGGTRRRAAHAYLKTRNGLEYARNQGAQYLAFEIWALLCDYWRYTPKPGGSRFGNIEHHVASLAFRRGATLGVLDFLRRRWGPPPAELLRESDIDLTVAPKV